jgi:lysozyme
MPITDVASLIKANEGCKLFPYTDTVGKLTIGVGRNLTDCGISQEEAEALFTDDLDQATRNLEAGIPWTVNLDEVRKAVMLDLCFNMGLQSLLTFTTFLRLMATGDYAGAADDLAQTHYATQVGARAVQNCNLLRFGDWPA